MKSHNLKKVVAIDGPAAVGKTTVGKKLAEKLGFVCFDTGVMYRAVTYAVIHAGVDYRDESEVSSLAWKVNIDILPPSQNDGRMNDVLIEGEDATWQIRLAEVNKLVSEVSAYPEVRQAMTEQQRRIAGKGKIVMLGRDIGSVVLPQAPCKVYLDASQEVRAERRFAEEQALNSGVTYLEVLDSIRHRDELDSKRKTAPLIIPADALVINTDCLSIDEVVDQIFSYYQSIQSKPINVVQNHIKGKR
ncbi:MAG TPA: (d)CMP kinase [Anaerolineaceae bacterium]|nr:(d)CMP kinase [Anaerolineaceae bacterium]